MKCGRCNKDLEAANKHNAYYIQNANDIKTYGDSTITEYILEKKDGTIVVDSKYTKIKQLEDIEREALENNIQAKSKKLVNANEELDTTTPDEKDSALAKKEQKLSEYEFLINAKQKIFVHTREVIKSVPKTLIICKACKFADDIVIW